MLNTLAEPRGLVFRFYAFKELATFYFPTHRPEQASRKLSHLFRGDAKLWDELTARGFKKGARKLTPAQVEVVLSYLGTPADFYAVCHDVDN